MDEYIASPVQTISTHTSSLLGEPTTVEPLQGDILSDSDSAAFIGHAYQYHRDIYDALQP